MGTPEERRPLAGRWLMMTAALGVAGLSLGPIRAQVFMSAEKALQLAFPDAQLARKVIALTKAQRADVAARTGLKRPSALLKAWIATRDGAPAGYAIVSDVLGKARPITYMLATDASLTVTRVEVLVYRESHGSQVRQAGWRRQFVGADPTTPLRLGRGIRNIVGATISCRSLTEGIRRNLAYLAVAFPDTATVEAPPADLADTVTGPGLFHRSRMLMGTLLEVSVHAADAASAERASEAAYDEVAAVEAALSSWRPSSALSAMNQQAGEPPRRRPTVLIDFLVRSRAWSQATGGAVDITAGPLVKLWRRGAATDDMPDTAEIDAARALVGDDILLLDPVNAQAGLTRAGAALDAGAIAKGYALDRAAAELKRHGISSALLNFGGQVLATAPGPDHAPWRVRFRSAPTVELLLDAGSVAVTGDSERALKIGARALSHVVDPRTGHPVTAMKSVMVHADNATDADALSTALFVMGDDEAVRWATERGVSARIEDHARITYTADFNRLLKARTEDR